MDEFKISQAKTHHFLNIIAHTNEIINKTEEIKKEFKALDMTPAAIEKIRKCFQSYLFKF